MSTKTKTETGAGETAARSRAIRVGDTLTARSLCDYDCIYTIRILKRTAKTATFTDYHGPSGATRTSKIRTEWDGCESIRPDRYSMAPTFRAKEAA